MREEEDLVEDEGDERQMKGETSGAEDGLVEEGRRESGSG